MRVVRSGDFIEIYKYSEGFDRKLEEDKVSIKSDFIEKETIAKNDERTLEEKSEDDDIRRSMHRAKQTIRRTINSNVDQWNTKGETLKFMTLTFAENIQDAKIANKHFYDFILRLTYSLTKKKKRFLKYTVVVELQERGAIHYHVVFYNLPYVESSRLDKIWGNGFIRINAIQEVDNLGAYVVKYLGKDLFITGDNVDEDEKMSKLKKIYALMKDRNSKLHFSSKGLIKPVIEDFGEDIEMDLDGYKLLFETEFSNEHIGEIQYQQLKK